MPRKPMVPCKHPNCARLVSAGTKYCDEHAPLHRSDVKSTKVKGYDNRWRKARARFLKAHPLCVRCMGNGRITRATVVDHVIPHRGDKALFWDEKNWQALCKSCHDKKTMTEDRHQEYQY